MAVGESNGEAAVVLGRRRGADGSTSHGHAFLRWGLGLAVLAVSTPVMAMDQCPAGTGPSPWLGVWFWGSLVLSLVLIVVRFTLLRTVKDQPRPEGQGLAVFVAVLSPFVGFGILVIGILTCPPRTQSPEVLCEHFAEEAQESRVPVNFDVDACLTNWRAEQEQLSSGEYRELSSCARRVWLGWMDRTTCTREGFDPARHAPGNWPSDEEVERWQSDGAR